MIGIAELGQTGCSARSRGRRPGDRNRSVIFLRGCHDLARGLSSYAACKPLPSYDGLIMNLLREKLQSRQGYVWDPAPRDANDMRITDVASKTTPM